MKTLILLTLALSACHCPIYPPAPIEKPPPWDFVPENLGDRPQINQAIQ